jgi:nitrogen PTS system EIIA component
MKISEFLSPNDALIDVRASHKGQLLQDLARKAASALNVPADIIASALTKREELGSTGMGNGIAIPHARIAAVMKPFGMVAKLRQAVDFDAIDGRPVDVVFLLLLPAASSDGNQLGALASVARKLGAQAIVERMRQAKEPADLYSAMLD